MSVMREHSESIIAVLEAFVYDPLINWRLFVTTDDNADAPNNDASLEDPRPNRKQTENQVQYQLQRQQQRQQQHQQQHGLIDDDDDDDDVVGSNNNTTSTVQEPTEEINQRALQVIDRVKQKLSGRDFRQTEVLPVATQVNLLIQQATSSVNLCQCYVGWCPFW